MIHDLKLERFGAEADGPIKTFVLRGIKDSPPYLHDGRLLTLEDTVEFFNVIGGTQLTEKEKRASRHSCGPCRRADALRRVRGRPSWCSPFSFSIQGVA